ncbi:hypothetical protein Desti_1042 [Desulfomonile tiedjei DSM 6799]|uniref:Uncharacterized protein n=1 Tax=Desulfomonile tiedjei (strain ATCC 49306 / DSM 6799 / DCB-1) TaxID=706587 RepID=I4C2G7_DESTA|nr:hypothetical protein Desti_1042 [Desulfomonile tiedjei DSM 6799]
MRFVRVALVNDVIFDKEHVEKTVFPDISDTYSLSSSKYRGNPSW